MKTYVRLISCVITMVVMGVSVYASDLTIPQSTAYPFKSMAEIQDDYVCGRTTTGNIGCIGQGFSGGTVTALTGETGRPGLLRRETSAVSGTIASLTTNVAQNTYVYDNDITVTWIARLNTNDANTTVRYGMMNSHTSNPPGNGIYIEKLDADVNWFCVTKNGGASTRTDSTVAVGTGFTIHTLIRNSSGVQFQINGANVCGIHTSNIPTGVTSVATHIVNSAAVNKTHDIDYVGVTVYGLTR